ncbi:MAG: DEAD/DEAH box helicase family protein, partial [Selenomonadaceae bacterium]|nr:DEAD/DEAH box helicase family protein [Selenomonadaceae bacterium]
MELKSYQEQAIRDLQSFLDFTNQESSLSKAYAAYWETKDVPARPPYCNRLPGVPHICFKVPTGGGKTFMAAASIRPIFEAIPLKYRAVVWLVPSETILSQTYGNLADAGHPYRQRLERDFHGRVEIYGKEALLAGQNFSAAAVGEQLSVFVLSYDSFRTKSKEGRKAYQENGNLAAFVDALGSEADLLPEVDATALIQAVRSFHPLVIVDESHHAVTPLSLEMLQNFNPSFILELTATPKKESNVISYVPARRLKDENMVKLPVIVYPRQSQGEAIEGAIHLRHVLEEYAKGEAIPGKPPIRPIVLFQAETAQKGKEDRATFDRIKANLIKEHGIPEEEIAIKTATVNDLKGVDLMAADCPIRYIITINALKEGWDCPFAYVLASLANRTSPVEVEQILGRILRRPYARQMKNEFLNLCYVFTASEDFRQTLDNIVAGLNRAGFSEKEYRLASEAPEDVEKASELVLQPLPGMTEIPSKESATAAPGKNTAVTATSVVSTQESGAEDNVRPTGYEVQPTNSTINDEVRSLLYAAHKGNESYQQTKPVDNRAPEEQEKMTHFKVKASFADALELCLPQFFLKASPQGLFSQGEEQFLTKESLWKGFTLRDKDTEIDFGNLAADIFAVDVEEDDLPKYKKLTSVEALYFQEHFSKLAKEQKKNEAIQMMTAAIDRKRDALDTSDIRQYVARILETFDEDMLDKLAQNQALYSRRISEKISSLMESHAKKAFDRQLAVRKIFCRPSFRLPQEISPLRYTKNIAGSLYEAEEDRMNDFEHRAVMGLSSLPNIRWWHRNMERKGFFINGFLNHYPDFLAMTKSGVLLAIETKGDDRDNSDSRRKLDLGKAWEGAAGGQCG